MKAIQIKWIWAVVAVLAVCLTACDTVDEPQPPLNTSQENPEPWGDETPHVFYFDLDRISLPLNEDGCLYFNELNKDLWLVTPTLDSIVMDKEYYGYDAPTKNGVVWGPFASTSFSIQGKRATPFNNVEVYKQMCRTIGVRPDSKFNNFPELADLPVRRVYPTHSHFQLDTLISTDIITHTYFNKDCPAGSSMRGNGNITDHPTYMGLEGVSGAMFFEWWRSENNVDAKYPWLPEVPNIALGTYTGGCLHYNSCIMPVMTLYIVGYPEKAGDYPMTMYMKFASGRTLSQDFKIRFVDKE